MPTHSVGEFPSRRRSPAADRRAHPKRRGEGCSSLARPKFDGKNISPGPGLADDGQVRLHMAGGRDARPRRRFLVTGMRDLKSARTTKGPVYQPGPAPGGGSRSTRRRLTAGGRARPFTIPGRGWGRLPMDFGPRPGPRVLQATAGRRAVRPAMDKTGGAAVVRACSCCGRLALWRTARARQDGQTRMWRPLARALQATTVRADFIQAGASPSTTSARASSRCVRGGRPSGAIRRCTGPPHQSTRRRGLPRTVRQPRADQAPRWEDTEVGTASSRCLQAARPRADHKGFGETLGRAFPPGRFDEIERGCTLFWKGPPGGAGVPSGGLYFLVGWGGGGGHGGHPGGAGGVFSAGGKGALGGRLGRPSGRRKRGSATASASSFFFFFFPCASRTQSAARREPAGDELGGTRTGLPARTGAADYYLAVIGQPEGAGRWPEGLCPANRAIGCFAFLPRHNTAAPRTIPQGAGGRKGGGSSDG